MEHFSRSAESIGGQPQQKNVGDEMAYRHRGSNTDDGLPG